MDSKKIRIELFKISDQKTMKNIADDLGVSKAAVSMVVKRKIKSRRIMNAIAEAIGKSPESVWPEEFLKKAC